MFLNKAQYVPFPVSVSVSVGFLLFHLPRNLDLLAYIYTHALTVYECHTPASKNGQATDSYFALIHACQCGVLMDNAG